MSVLTAVLLRTSAFRCIFLCLFFSFVILYIVAKTNVIIDAGRLSYPMIAGNGAFCFAMFQRISTQQNK